MERRRNHRAIVAFVEGVVDPDGAGFAPPAKRIAVFDNDGTPWCEKPMQIQMDSSCADGRGDGGGEPALHAQQPWQAARERDYDWLGAAMTQPLPG